MEKETYSTGRYSQVKFNDGKRLLIETLPQAITARKVKVILIPIPGEIVWRRVFMKQIRTSLKVEDAAIKILDQTLKQIEDCKTISEAINKLNLVTL